jgi:hypothetical protein
LKAFDTFRSNFGIGEWPTFKSALKAQQQAACTYLTGKAVNIIETKQPKADKRTKLQAGLAELANFRASESELDAVLRTAIEKNMRV